MSTTTETTTAPAEEPKKKGPVLRKCPWICVFLGCLPSEPRRALVPSWQVTAGVAYPKQHPGRTGQGFR